jgi:hypothetical protein
MALPKEQAIIKKMKYAKGVLEDVSKQLAELHTRSVITKEAHEELLAECQEINQFVIEMVLFIKACNTAQKAG